MVSITLSNVKNKGKCLSSNSLNVSEGRPSIPHRPQGHLDRRHVGFLHTNVQVPLSLLAISL